MRVTHHPSPNTSRLCVRRAWNVFKASMFLARHIDKEIIIFQKADKATLIYAYLLTTVWWYYSAERRIVLFTFEILRTSFMHGTRISIYCMLRFACYYSILNSTNRNSTHYASFNLAEYISSYWNSSLSP